MICVAVIAEQPSDCPAELPSDEIFEGIRIRGAGVVIVVRKRSASQEAFFACGCGSRR